MGKRILFIDSNHPRLHEKLMAQGYQCDLFYEKDSETLKKMLPAYDGCVIRSKFKITKDLIDTCTHLKVIARAGAGMENIDVDYAISKGIQCVHAPEGNMDAVGEHALAMLLNLFNNIKKADKEVREGKWIREGNRGVELMGKTLGIIGYGNMGSAFAKRLSGFGVKVLAYDKYKTGFSDAFVKESRIEELFEKCDIISLHVPLTDETRYMINRAFISQFKKDIYIINTARGKCLNTADLAEAMKSGKVKGACLDVLEYEAVSFEGLNEDQIPAPLQYLFSSENCILTPHIAGWTKESNIKIAEILADKIIAAFN